MMFEVGRGKTCEVKLAVGRSPDKDLRRSRPPKVDLSCYHAVGVDPWCPYFLKADLSWL